MIQMHDINQPRIQDTPLSLDTLLTGSERDDCGALAVFAGTVRNHHEGKPECFAAISCSIPRIILSASAACAV